MKGGEVYRNIISQKGQLRGIVAGSINKLKGMSEVGMAEACNVQCMRWERIVIFCYREVQLIVNRRRALPKRGITSVITDITEGGMRESNPAPDFTLLSTLNRWEDIKGNTLP